MKTTTEISLEQRVINLRKDLIREIIRILKSKNIKEDEYYNLPYDDEDYYKIYMYFPGKNDPYEGFISKIKYYGDIIYATVIDENYDVDYIADSRYEISIETLSEIYLFIK